MRSLILCVITLVVFHSFSFSQSDTTYMYYDQLWKPCAADTAFYTAKVYKQGDMWTKKDYYKQSNRLQMEGAFLEKDLTTRQGPFTWYKEDGTKDYTILFKKGEVIDKTFYYANGATKAYISYADGTQKGWDENGKEIKNFVVEKEAKPKVNWQKYLEHNLNPNVAAKANAPAGMYAVKMQFQIDKEGNITNVLPVSVPAQCAPCALEAIRVISAAPRWEPAMQNGVPVIYQAIQFITFQVAEEPKKKKD